ncbi:MAG: glycosyltransferase family 39 protein [Candidatus Kuenenia sp.]|nr:glycosyltransferase family 39 protein [Candidatus Kuenenia hertensis]
MNQTSTNIRLLTVILALFISFLFLFNTGKRDLWAPDEPRYAQVSKEMRDSGNFILPQLNGEPYPHKPPLLFWMVNLFSIPFGKITHLSGRLPSAFAGIGCCLLLFNFGRNVFHNTRIGLLSALILATSIKFLWMSHRVAFDVLLTFFVMAAIFSFYKGYTEDRNKGRSYTLFYVFMAFGVLTKGPVGFLLPFLTVVAYLFLKRDIKSLKETKPWIGGVLFAIIVFAWVYLASIYGGKEYTQQILFKQNVGRFADSFAHKRPFYYYFIQFPLNYFPWTIFIPSAVLYLFSREGRKKFQEISFPAVWFVVLFFFFSIVSGKRDIYVLPLYPAASLIIAWFFNEFIEQFRNSRFRRIGYVPCYFASGLSICLGVLLPIGVYKFLPEHVRLTIPFVLLLFAGGVIMLRYTKRSRILPFLFVLILLVFSVFTISTLQAIPLLNQHKSAKEICGKANAIMKPDEQLAMYNFLRDTYLFYTNRNHIEVIYGLEELKKYLHSEERVFIFITEKDFKKVTQLSEIPAFVLARDSVGHRKMLFVSNKDI